MNPDAIARSRMRKGAKRAEISGAKSKTEIKPEDLHNDLCATCVNRVNCIYRAKDQGPVYDCEDYEAAPGMEHVPVQAPESRVVPTYKGLCATCEHRADCTLARPESGVWHCEEYE